ncbi:MAG: rhomboid family intramembrane serine protease [Candidatus Kerfeldbacteria bacterium]
MIPLRDHTPSGKRPFITYFLIAANVAVFAYMLTLGSTDLDAFLGRYSFIPNDIVHGQNLFTVLTAMFLHGGFMHLIGNMLFLYIFGDNMEERLGRFRFLLFYIAAGAIGSALQIVIDPHSTVLNLGASGAIAGTMGGYLVLFPNERIDVLWGIWGVTAIPAKAMLIYWIVFQFISGAGSIGYQGGVAYFAHIGGFAFGYLVTKFFVRKKTTSARWLE